MTKQDSKTHRAETPAAGGPDLGDMVGGMREDRLRVTAAIRSETPASDQDMADRSVRELEKMRSALEERINAEQHPRVEWVSLREGVTCPAQRQTAPAGATGKRAACPMKSHTWFPGTTYSIEYDEHAVYITHKNDQARSLVVPLSNVAEIMIRRTDEP